MPKVTFDSALNHHRAGRLAEAVRLYQQIIVQDPAHGDSTFLLGVIQLQSGDAGSAVNYFKRATTLDPKNAAYQANLGEALRRVGRLSEAIKALLASINLKPDLIEPVFNLGIMLREGGLLDAAAACFETAVEARPDSVQFAMELARTRSARASLGESEPVDSEEKSLAAASLSSTVLIELAEAQKCVGRREQAVRFLRRALSHHPTNVVALVRLADLLRGLGHSNEAVDRLRTAMQIVPQDREVIERLASILQGVGRLEESIPIFRQLIALSDTTELRSIICLTLPYLPGYDAEAILAEARDWALKHALPLASLAGHFDNDVSLRRRLRIGYVSPHFRVHVDSYFLGPLLANLDKASFEIFLYSDVKNPDEETANLRHYADAWRDIVSLSDEQVAEVIRQDRMDILVDLQMHTEGNRLLVFARKPAPVQLCWLAYAGTTGLSTMDYRITDWYLDPPDADMTVYSERSLRLADSFWCFDPHASGPDVNTLPALAAGKLTFGCLNNICKINDSVLELFARVLNAVHESNLILYAPFGDVRRNMAAKLAIRGVDSSRVEFVDNQPRPEYLATYHRIDVCLDTFPYNGGTTSLEALWMGVPVLTLVGTTVMGRAGYSLAMNLGLKDFVATTPEQYVRIAVELGHDLPRLAALRAELRSRLEASPLMDGPRFARIMGCLYREIWTEWCRSAGAESRQLTLSPE